MKFSDNYQALMSQVTNSINASVKCSTLKSQFLIHDNCLSLSEFYIIKKDEEIVEVHKNCLVSSSGVPYHFHEISFDELCQIADSF